MNIPDNIERDKLDRLSEQMRADEAEALKTRHVLVRWSERRWIVVRLGGAVPAGGKSVFAGEVVYGPNTKEDCEDCISKLSQ